MDSIRSVFKEFSTPDEMFRTLARDMLAILPNSDYSKENFSLIISGGRSPVFLHRLLIEQSLNFSTKWNKILFFFSDERCVSPYDDSSNYAMANDTLFLPLNIQQKNVFRIKGELAPNRAAIEYHDEISEFFAKVNHSFDLALLGMGSDGHTASLFPQASALNIHDKFAVSAGVGPDSLNRISMTYRSLNASKKVFVMVTGENKKSTLDKALQSASHFKDFPIKGIQPIDELIFYISP